MVTIYNTPLSTTSEKALFGRPGGENYIDILNFFDNRSTNASAESFNAKIKNFRAQLRGISDIKYFLFRLQKIYAQYTGFSP